MKISAFALAAAIACVPQVSWASTYTLKFFQVDDDLSAYITNSSYNGQLVLHHGFGPDYPFVDITPFVRNGLNTLNLELVNGPMGWTYGLDLWVRFSHQRRDICQRLLRYFRYSWMQ